MEKDVVNYIRKHTFLVTVVVVVVFMLLAFGEYFLYRKIMLVNQMVSEGFMQVKELNKGGTGEEIDLMMEELNEGTSENGSTAQ